MTSRFNERRVALWGVMGALCAAGVALALTFGSSRFSTLATTSPNGTVHPTYVLRPLEECPGQRYLTETETYEVDRVMGTYLDGRDTVPPYIGDPNDPTKELREGYVAPTPEVLAQLPAADDYPPEYYAAIDPDGDHCENPVPDELMLVDWSKLGPGSTTTSTTTTTTPTTKLPTTTSSTTSTTVAACSFSGFFSPVDNSPVVNVVKAGAAVPVKFGFCQSGSLAIFASGSPSSAPHTCGSAPTDEIESTVAVSTSGLSFDTTTRRYQYNWKTDGAWVGQCRTLSLRFVDGTVKRTEFRFR